MLEMTLGMLTGNNIKFSHGQNDKNDGFIFFVKSLYSKYFTNWFKTGTIGSADIC